MSNENYAEVNKVFLELLQRSGNNVDIVFDFGEFMKTNLTLDTLVKKKEQLEARIQNIKSREAMQQRKDETRRKILVGSYILDKHQKAGTIENLFSELDKFLFKPFDRALFGFDARKEEKANSGVPESIGKKS